MRDLDDRSRRLEAELCLMGDWDQTRAEPVFEWAWNLAIRRALVETASAHEIYLSILGIVRMRLVSGESPMLVTPH